MWHNEVIKMIYLDYAATTNVDHEVLEGYYKLLSLYFANAASLHSMGKEAATFLATARTSIARLLRIQEEEVLFTSGASESNNLAIKGVAFAYKNRGKHIITSKVEHASVINTCKQLEANFGFEVTYLDVDQFGRVTLQSVQEAVRDDTILISIMHVNNEIGTIMPVEEIADWLKKNHSQVVFHVDITQSLGKIHLNLNNIDLLSFSAHKIHGLKGSGALIKKNKVQLLPLIVAGSQEYNLRGGTSFWQVDVILAKTLRKALEHQDENFKKVSKLQESLVENLLTIDELVMNSPKEKVSPYVINFSLPKRKSEVIVNSLSEKGFCVSTLSACSSKSLSASPTILAMTKDLIRASSAIRISLDGQISFEDLQNFYQALKKVLEEVR